MALITNLKFGEVDNLSDARFAAGSQATYIGFSFDPESDAYIESDKFREIAGWINGPSVIGEFGAQDLRDVKNAIKEFNLNFVQLNETTNFFSLKELKNKAKIIQNIDLAEFRTPEEVEFFIEDSYKDVTYYMLSLYDEEEMEDYLSTWDNKKLIRKLCNDLNIILNFPFEIENVESMVRKYNPYAINIYPGVEEKPGLKDFDELIQLVEQLED